MSEDLDDLLRRAMKTLEDQVPPGYFDELPKQTLARLEDSSMHDERNDAGASQTAAEASPTPAAAPAATPPAPTPATALATGTGAPPPDPVAPPPGAAREEDSGLHDIRSLASSQRMRISSKRSSQSKIDPDEDLLASASGSWKAVALPEPAKMISLPELSELPPAHEVKEVRPKRDSKARVEAAAPPAAQTASAALAPQPREAAAAVEAPVAPIAAAREKAKEKAKPQAKPAAGKGGARKAMFAAVGFAVAAAAGAVFVVSTQTSEDKATGSPVVQAADKDGVALPALRSVTPPAAAAPEPMEIAAGSAVAETAPAPAPAPEPAPDKGAPPPPPKPGKSVGKYVPNVVEDPKGPEKPKGDEPKKKPEPGDPDFNKLLQEAGYQEKKDDKPKIDKKSLSGDDIKKGMNGVAGKVTACYAGTEGSAVVKVIVAGTGQVQKVSVSGVFAGTPVGACVEAAVRGAAFPAFDGEQQTINFSYLLSE